MKNTLLLLFLVTLACAITTGDVHAQVQANNLEDKLRPVFGDKKIEIRDYDKQLKEVVVESNNFFATHDGRYVFAGQIIDTEREVDIVAERDDLRRQAVLDSLPDDLFVSYPSIGAAKHKITVFTDIDCPYCRKLHNTMSALNQQGVSVNYVMVPRAGLGSASYVKTLNALCSDKPAETITKAMQRTEPAVAKCDPKQLDQQMKLARDLKIFSTPTIVLPDGKLQVGLIKTQQLISMLEERE